jgi:hypothetical protein
MNEQQRKIYSGIGIAIGIIGFYIVKSFLFQAPSIDKQNMMIASEINKSCPIMVDSETRLDNLIALPENILAYNYTLINLVKDSLNPLEIEKAVKPMMAKTIKTHPDMEYQRKNKTTLSYNYRDMNGEHVLQFSIGPKDYEE